jgi:hypothetical protein
MRRSTLTLMLLGLCCSPVPALGSPAAAPTPRPAAEPPPATPPENAAKGTLPDLASAEAMAKRLLAAIVAGDADAAVAAFFPRAPFLALKAIKSPGDYHDQLVRWFRADVQREHERVKSLGPLVFDGLRKGGCVWKEKGSEANAIAYWSCYKSRFFARPATPPAGKAPQRLEFQLRAMINWGSDWYVTHLGPIPK